jgi:hypothetical protein
MAAGDVADGEGHGEDGESEGKGHAEEADAKRDAIDGGSKGGGEDGGATTAEDKPESAEELGCCTFGEMHRVTCSFFGIDLSVWEKMRAEAWTLLA